ncbi:MAG TPA: type II toxin-antitoxin system VapC family toxin [Candidatus Acidoferrum sp.]|nr:type II toxin-antitoxin system VapC family toxin [Candidatus Acidoferrum sp.]
MRLLLDTHTLLWWLADDQALPPRARKNIGSRTHTIYVSAATAWEVATKYRIGKLPQGAELASRFDSIVASESFEPLPISSSHGVRAGMLPGPHRDPFDRMLIAQAQTEDLILVSNDRIFDEYKLHRLWD